MGDTHGMVFFLNFYQTVFFTINFTLVTRNLSFLIKLSPICPLFDQILFSLLVFNLLINHILITDSV